ncbi:MAG: hypothetical protein AB1646_26525 [Thermodesulfobacteriota bacterium]
MAGQYPFPFTESIRNAYTKSPVWERFAPDWTPNSEVPLHLECMCGWMETAGDIIGFYWDVQERLMEDGSKWAENVRVYTSTLNKAMLILEELINFGMDTIPIDPVVLRAVAKARKNHRNLLHLCETAEEDCTDLPTDSLDSAESGQCDA